MKAPEAEISVAPAVAFRRSTLIRVGAAAVALAAAVWVGLSFIAPGIDALHQLAWGAVVGDGVRPRLTAALTPLSHPLQVAVGTLLSPLGAEGAYDAFSVLSAFSIGLLLYAVYRLARVLAGDRAAAWAPIAAGGLAIALALIRPRFELYALEAVIEVPFAALLFLAASYVAESPRSRPWRPLALLAVAGLLRPEGWVLGLLYLGWLAWHGVRGRALAGLAALVLCAPILWFSFDLAMTENLLNSSDPDKLPVARESFEFERPEPGDAGLPEWLPGTPATDKAIASLRGLLGDPIALVGLGVILWALLPWPGRAGAGRARFAIVAGAALLMLAQNLLLAEFFTFPLPERYFFTPALAMLVLAAAAALAIPNPRLAAGAGALLLAVMLAIYPQKPITAFERPGQFGAVSDEQRDLMALTGDSEVRTAVRSGCGRVVLGGWSFYKVLAARPLVAMSLSLDLPRVKLLRFAREEPNLSIFRRKGDPGPPPYRTEGVWVYRSECLPGGGRPEGPARKVKPRRPIHR
jgi:hypothetical protein